MGSYFEYPVGKLSFFLLFEYNRHFSCPPPKNVKGGAKIFFALLAKYFHLALHISVIIIILLLIYSFKTMNIIYIKLLILPFK